MEVKGILHAIYPTKQVSSAFSTREFVIRTEEQYPQFISLQLVNNATDVIDAYQIGAPIIVSINLRGREWTNPQGEVKYFNTIQAWKVQPQALQANPAYNAGQPAQAAPAGQPQYSTGQPQYTAPNQAPTNYAPAQPQYAAPTAQPQYATGQTQYSTGQPQQGQMFNANGNDEDLPF